MYESKTKTLLMDLYVKQCFLELMKNIQKYIYFLCNDLSSYPWYYCSSSDVHFDTLLIQMFVCVIHKIYIEKQWFLLFSYKWLSQILRVSFGGKEKSYIVLWASKCRSCYLVLKLA